MSAASFGAVTVHGTLGTQVYGYEDAAGGNHLWLLPAAQLSVYHPVKPWSAHFAAGYLGDRHDRFSASGRGRLTQAVVRLGGVASRSEVSVGRFFLYNSTAVGVLDGAQLSFRPDRRLKLSLFGGLMGPTARTFDLEDLDQAAALGGEASWYPADRWGLSRLTLKLGYSAQRRTGETFRRRVGLTAAAQAGRRLAVSAAAQFRPDGGSLKRAAARARYRDPVWTGMLEVGAWGADYADYSWFRNLELPGFQRVRLTGQRTLFGNWAAGMEAAGLFSEGAAGFRLGPILITPWGQAGYRLQTGDQPRADGPWVNATTKLKPWADVYVFASRTTYEWEAVDLDEAQVGALQLGARLKPRPGMNLSAEYQVFTSPQWKSDRRFLAGVSWDFAVGGNSK